MMMVHMVLYKNLNLRLCYECESTVPKLENIMLNRHKAKCKYEQLYSKSTDYVKHLKGYRGMEMLYIIISVYCKQNIEECNACFWDKN